MPCPLSGHVLFGVRILLYSPSLSQLSCLSLPEYLLYLKVLYLTRSGPCFVFYDVHILFLGNFSPRHPKQSSSLTVGRSLLYDLCKDYFGLLLFLTQQRHITVGLSFLLVFAGFLGT